MLIYSGLYVHILKYKQVIFSYILVLISAKASKFA